MRLAFSRETGALTGVEAVQTGWRILDRPHLGLAFRLLVPTRSMLDWHGPGRRSTTVLGDRQPLAGLELGADGRSATFTWSRGETDDGERLQIGLSLHVTLDDRQAVFAMTIDNHSPYPVENVYVPYLGDLRPPEGATWLKAFGKSAYATAGEWDVWPVYDSLLPYFGIDHPQQIGTWAVAACSPANPFILLRSEDQGLCVSPANERTDLVAWHTELLPGHASWLDQRVPSGETIAGRDVAIRFAPVQLPHLQPGERRTLVPIALEPYRGTWHAGVDRYRRRRDAWIVPAPVPDWAREPHAWQQIQVNSPEDRFAIRSYRELVEIGESCARHGVRAIQVTGWNDGGQDQGNPSHDHDPRLGTREELADAIRAIQALGVRVILFSKFTWADGSTPRYHDELRGLAIRDVHGDAFQHGGYGYGTATTLLGINRRRLIPMCFLAERWLEICEEEFAKVLALGADGTLYDECQHHSPALQCFADDHGHPPGAGVYGNDDELIRRFRARSDAVRPDFLYAGEDIYDRQRGSYALSYIRTESAVHVPLLRYLDPRAALMTAVTGYDDRNLVNQSLLYRYVMSYEPLQFKGRLEEIPLTVAYGRRMDALRTELRDWFWDGDFRDTQGGMVTVDGRPHAPYAIHLAAGTGAPGVVGASYDPERTITAHVRLDDGRPLTRYRLVDDDAWRPVVDGTIVVPPRSAAVVLP
ncbi:MAG: DUF6259 domain-containing protein [Chloroflexota bacterium]